MSNQPYDTTENNPTKDVAADEAKKVADTARHGGENVADTAKSEAQHLAQEAKGQAQDLFHQVRSEAGSQFSTQQERVTGGLRSLSGELDKMAEGADSGMASDLVSRAAGQVEGVASWLDGRDAGDLLGEVRRYARRNPGTFLAGAAILGFVGGRLTRGLQSDGQDDRSRGYQGRGYEARGYDDRGLEGRGYDARAYGYRPGYAETTGYSDTAGYTQQGAGDARTDLTGAQSPGAYGGVTNPDTGLFDQDAQPVPYVDENGQAGAGYSQTVEGRPAQRPEGDLPR